MSVILVVTHKDGVNCGVEDYTDKLALAINEYGYEAKVYKISTWSLKNLYHLKKHLLGFRSLNVQYPSAGMGKSPIISWVPFVFRNKKLFLTLHEFHVFSPIRKIYLFTYAYTPCTLIFSNAYEKYKFEKFYPYSICKKLIIPIGSNIDVTSIPEDGDKTSKKIIYFGQISQNKGIEQFIGVIENLRKSGVNNDATIMGSALDRNSELYSFVTKECTRLRINLIENASSSDVSKNLLSSSIAVLPYPDGVSEKRGTALACLDHRLLVITTHSIKTPDWLEKSTLKFIDEKTTALKIMSIISGDDTYNNLYRNASEAMLNTRWPTIAKLFIKLYSNI